MAYGEVGGGSVVIPDHEATGNMVVEFSRNVKDFPINQYAELRPVTKMRGFYCRIDPAQGARNKYGDGREYLWPGGANRPTGANNRSQFEFEEYETVRKAYTVPLDDRDVGQASWPVAEVELRKEGQQAMTDRTLAALTALTGASWPTGNTSAVGSIPSGGAWNSGTSTNPYMQICIQYAQAQILLATAGVIRPSDLVLVTNPNTAKGAAQSQEIRSYVANSIYAQPYLEGRMAGDEGNNNWGLPRNYQGTPIVVEDAVRVSSSKGPSSTTSVFCLADGDAFLLCRPKGQLVHPAIQAVERGERKMTDKEREAVPVYSTLAGFFLEELTTEIYQDTWNRITNLGITSDFDYEITSLLSGFFFTGALA